MQRTCDCYGQPLLLQKSARVSSTSVAALAIVPIQAPKGSYRRPMKLGPIPGRQVAKMQNYVSPTTNNCR
jgi:hypothetical protein